MSALPRRRKTRRRLSFEANNQNPRSNSFLVIVLSLIVLIETIIILSFITKKAPPETIKKTKVAIRKVVPESPRITPGIGVEKRVLPIPRIVPKRRGKIAIVIDDWGYNKNNLEILKEIDSPLTLAILPFRDYSREVAEFAKEHNQEVIIHMPMEPEDKDTVALEPRTLMAYMSRSTIEQILKDAVSDIKYAKGISNHMGSYATQKKAFLKIVLKELKRNNLYFLDSYVIADSVAEEVAKEIGVKFAKRSIFLDNESDPRYIREQLFKLAAEAESNGKAVGICHDRVNTLFTLKEEIPKLASRGYQFVFVSEIVE